MRDSLDVQRPAPTADEPPRRPTDEIDLLAYADVVWQYRYLVVLAAMVIGIATYAINRATPPTYEVVFRLMVLQPRLTDEPVREENVVAFRELVESPMLVAGLLDELGLRGQPHNLTPQGFLAGHIDVSVIPNSTIIRVAVRLRDRDLVLKVGQRYAERVVELAQRLNTEGADYTIARIKAERDAAIQRLAASEKALEEYQRGAQIELVRNDVDALLLRRPEALDLTVEIQGERARVQQAEAELSRQERIRSVRRAVDSLPLATAEQPTERQQSPRREETQNRLPGDSASSLPQRDTRETPEAPSRRNRSQDPSEAQRAGDAPKLQSERLSTGRGGSIAARPPEPLPEEPRTQELRIRSELLDPYVNPVHDALTRDLAAARSRLAALEERRRELVSRLQLDAPMAQKLNRLYEAESGLAKLTRENGVAREAYFAAANKYEEARLQNAMRAPRLQILDAALPPDRAVAPRSLRNALTAMLIALTIGVIAVLIYDATRQRAA